MRVFKNQASIKRVLRQFPRVGNVPFDKRNSPRTELMKCYKPLISVLQHLRGRRVCAWAYVHPCPFLLLCLCSCIYVREENSHTERRVQPLPPADCGCMQHTQREQGQGKHRNSSEEKSTSTKICVSLPFWLRQLT